MITIFTVYLFNFAKKAKSTAVPDWSTGTLVQGELNRPFALISPDLIFDAEQLGLTPPTYNYAYVQDFNLYYRLSGWAFDSGLWSVHGDEDVLASHKDAILSQSAYVLRAAPAAGNPVNPFLADSTAVTTARVSHKVNTDTWSWSQEYKAGGTYVLGCLNDSGVTTGAITYYAINAAAFKSLMGTLLSSVDPLNIDDSVLNKSLQKALFSPSSYIISAIWLPFDIAEHPEIGESVGAIRLGWWTYGVAGVARLLPEAAAALQTGDGENIVRNVTRVIEIPKHSQSGELGSWVNNSPYAAYTLECIPFGSFPLPASDLLRYKYLRLSMTYDLLNGKGTLRVTGANAPGDQGDDTVLLNSAAQIGVQVPLAQITFDPGSGIKPAVAAGAEAINALPGDRFTGIKKLLGG